MKKPGMGKGQLVELRLDRAGYRRMAVAEAGDSRAAGPVEIPVTILINNETAITNNSGGHIGRIMPPENMSTFHLSYL